MKKTFILRIFHHKVIFDLKKRKKGFTLFLKNSVSSQSTLMNDGNKQCIVNYFCILLSLPTKKFECSFLTTWYEKIIIKIDSNKAHIHYMISIHMLKISYRSIWKPLKLIFRSCLVQEVIWPEWSKINVVTIGKK